MINVMFHTRKADVGVVGGAVLDTGTETRWIEVHTDAGDATFFFNSGAGALHFAVKVFRAALDVCERDGDVSTEEKLEARDVMEKVVFKIMGIDVETASEEAEE